MSELPPLPYPQMPGNDYTAADMRKYAEAAVKAEREAIAQMCDAYAIESAGWTEEEFTAQKIADMVRARGE